MSQFRVTRHSDLAVDEEDVRSLRTVLRQGLQQRNFGQAVRLEVSAGCSEFLCAFLLHQFELPEAAHAIAGDGHAADCACRRALDHALITSPGARDPQVVERLKAIAGRVL